MKEKNRNCGRRRGGGGHGRDKERHILHTFEVKFDDKEITAKNSTKLLISKWVPFPTYLVKRIARVRVLKILTKMETE